MVPCKVILGVIVIDMANIIACEIYVPLLSETREYNKY
jgi:hypothetical protein